MPLSVGDKVGQYEVVSLLGRGVMGEVYRARDKKLKREVEVKVLPKRSRATHTAWPDSSARHTNIAADRALVMELVEDNLPKGPLPFDETWNSWPDWRSCWQATR